MEAVLETPGPESVWKILQEVAIGLKEMRESQAEEKHKSKLEWQKLRESQAEEKRKSELEWQKLRESQAEEKRKSELEWQKLRESQDRTDRQMQETFRQLHALQDRTDKQIGRLGNRIGDLIALFTATNVIEKFQALGFEFTQASQNMKIQDKSHRDLAEVDIFLENGDFVMAMEVKTNLAPADVTEHLQRMDVLRTYADSRGDKRKFLGAIAAAIASKGVKELALSQGFYLLEQQGDNVRITEPETRRVW